MISRCCSGVPKASRVGATRLRVTLNVSWWTGVSYRDSTASNACRCSGVNPAPPASVGQSMAP